MYELIQLTSIRSNTSDLWIWQLVAWRNGGDGDGGDTSWDEIGAESRDQFGSLRFQPLQRHSLLGEIGTRDGSRGDRSREQRSIG